MIKKIIVGQMPTSKKLFVWNMIGSVVYSLASMILTYMTIRIIGEVEGGVFAIALTLAQMFLYIAYYEMRNYHVTDADDRYTFSEYHAVKIVTCIIMMTVAALFVWFKGYDSYKSLIILLVCFYRMLDGYADVFEAEFHKQGRLDLAGKSMTFRTVLSVGSYFFVLIITQNLLLAVAVAVFSGILGICIYNFWIFDSVGKLKISWNKESVKGILRDCFPLFLGMFLWVYLLSASRIAVDSVMPSEYQSYYQVLFMPISVINLLSGCLIRPSLIQLTELHNNKNMNYFWKIVWKMILILIAFTMICMVGAYVFGILILSLLTKCSLNEYQGMFVFLIFAGGINAIACLLYNVLMIFRNRFGILLGYGIASIAALLISSRMTERWQLWGASASYLVVMVVLMLVFFCCIAFEKSK